MQKHLQNVMLVGMASEISKNYIYKCVDRSRHNEIKGAMTKCVCTFSLGTLDSVVSGAINTLVDNHGSGYLGMARCFNVHS